MYAFFKLEKVEVVFVWKAAYSAANYTPAAKMVPPKMETVVKIKVVCAAAGIRIARTHASPIISDLIKKIRYRTLHTIK